MIKKTAIVTGASRGIGLEISKVLVELGYQVLGFARDFSSTSFEHQNFTKIAIDLSNIKELEKNLSLYKKKFNLSVLVHCAGIGIFGLHEELNFQDLEKMLQLNFVSPILISKFFLRELKENKGIIFHISSITAIQDSPLASAYSATKAGISHFGKSLFSEARKSGLKIINLQPDITQSDFYNQTWFEPDFEDPDSYIKVTDLGKYIKLILEGDVEFGYLDITLKPQKHKIKKKPR